MAGWSWWDMAMYAAKTIATLLAFIIALYACKLTFYWRGWVLLTLGLATAPFIGVLQILDLLAIPRPNYWVEWTGVIIPFISMMLVSWGAWEIVKQIRALLRQKPPSKRPPPLFMDDDA